MLQCAVVNNLTVEERLNQLISRGVRIVDPRQTFVDEEVQLHQIAPTSVLHPGTRLGGKRTWIGPGCQIGTEGPATIVNAVFDSDTKIASGYANGCVLLRNASLGANAHVRASTLIEEQASTAHCVGLKHTILLCFVTIGSLVNLCDCLMTGGTSRKDHSEVGSGYIHFNFTPWGKSGDKATASLIGEVPDGVLLRQPRIFLGGMGGLVGPAHIGFGAIAGAGQVVRNGIEQGHLVIQPQRPINRPIHSHLPRFTAERVNRNIVYIANLFALRAWYTHVRLPTTPTERKHVIQAAIAIINSAIDERIVRLDALLQQAEQQAPTFPDPTGHPCPLGSLTPQQDHVGWVKSLAQPEAQQLTNWLKAIVNEVTSTAKASISRPT